MLLRMDRWGLLHNGECAERSFAFFTICITDSEDVLTNCLASVCSLLATTDPPCVVAFVSLWVLRVAGSIFIKNGVLPVLAPEWASLPETHPYAHLQDRSYTFAKLEAFRLTQYERIATFDIDMVFMRDASSLRDVQPFAAARIPKGKDPDRYVNGGLMVIRPSMALYSRLASTWRSGDHGLHFSDAESTDQDVIIDLCVLQGACGPVTDLDACVYNHGSWLPHTFGRPCPQGTAVVRHNFYGSREGLLAARLQTAMYRGTCRPHSGLGVADEECWQGNFTREGCCRQARSVWGNSMCWGAGASYERCCVGISDSAMLREDLLHVALAPYGLTSMPEPTPAGWFSETCWRHYWPMRLTFGSMSSSFYAAPDSKDVPHSRASAVADGPAQWDVLWVHKCEGLGTAHLRDHSAVSVFFRFGFLRYFRRNKADQVVRGLHSSFVSASPETLQRMEAISTCMPRVCCMHQPLGVSSSMAGLRRALWNFITEFLLELPRQGLEIPEPSDDDFDEIYTFDRSGARTECFRT